MHFISFQHMSTYHAYPSVHFPNRDSLMGIQQCICSMYHLCWEGWVSDHNVHLHKIKLENKYTCF